MTRVRLGDAARFINGAAFKPEDWANEGLPIIRIQNLTGTGEHFNYTTRKVKDELVVEQGDLLVSWSATLDVYRWGGPKGLLNQHIFKVLPKPGVDPEFLYFALKSVIAELESKTHGSTMKHVVRGDFEDTRIHLPGIDQQRRIVDILSRADGIVRLRRQAQQKAAELIPAIFVDMFGDPATNPKGWPASCLRDLVDFQSGGTPSKARDDYWQGDVPWVSPKDMKRLALYDAIDHISSLVLAETSLKLVPAGSVLIVVRGMILAHTVPVAEARVPLTVNQDMKALIAKDTIHSTYLMWMLQVCHDRLLAQVTTAAHGTKKLDTARLEEIIIPVPPTAMQQAFEANVRRMEAIQQHQIDAAAKAEAAFSALLARAFAAAPAGAAVREAEKVGS